MEGLVGDLGIGRVDLLLQQAVHELRVAGQLHLAQPRGEQRHAPAVTANARRAGATSGAGPSVRPGRAEITA